MRFAGLLLVALASIGLILVTRPLWAPFLGRGAATAERMRSEASIVAPPTAVPDFSYRVALMTNEGYVVIERTSVSGQFSGCAPNRNIRLSDGWTFVCLGGGGVPAFEPDVTW